MVDNFFIFLAALLMVIKGATWATKYAAQLAESYRLSKYTVGFIIIAVISILPEIFISMNAAVAEVPAFALGMLFGSNVADLTLVFAIIIFLAGRRLKVESKVLKNHVVYPFLLLLPLVLGFDGRFSRLEGVALIITGAVFYYTALKNGIDGSVPMNHAPKRYKIVLMLLGSMALLLVGAHFTVTAATGIANYLGVNPILVGMLIVGLGTTMPELFISLHAVRHKEDSLAIGDILGTVLADATIVVGILALVSPFVFPQKIIYVTGLFMLAASLVLFSFMLSGKEISKKEAVALFCFWLTFVVTEFFANR